MCVHACVCVHVCVCVCVCVCVRACVFRELACSIGTNSHAAAEKVYAAASDILEEKLFCRLPDMTDAQVALEDPRRIAALLAAQNSAARSAGGRSLALCTHTHTHTHMCVCCVLCVVCVRVCCVVLCCVVLCCVLCCVVLCCVVFLIQKGCNI